MEREHELNERRAAPTELWVGLALMTIATIILLVLLTHDGRQGQTRTEKKIAYLKTHSYGKEKILSLTGTRSFKI